MSATGRAPTRTVISTEQLCSWLDQLALSSRLIAPVETAGVCLYRQVSTSQAIAWNASRPLLSLKEVFFPPTERLLTIHKKGRNIDLEETFLDDPQVVFGVRPCDARGARLLDALFLDTPPADPYYARRREKTTLIGLACREMGPGCFCTSTGGAPDSTDGLDLLLTEVTDGYALDILTEKGQALLTGWSLPEFTGTSSAKIRPSPAQFAIPPLESLLERFNDDYWQQISERCLSCRACAYVCPTCRCFAVRDQEIRPGEFERIRCWDACAGENYRRLAGGHRPRPAKAERLRNRFYCKFCYFPRQTGLVNTSACTGCGRCIEVCLAGVDITEILADLGRLA